VIEFPRIKKLDDGWGYASSDKVTLIEIPFVEFAFGVHVATSRKKKQIAIRWRGA
jgi:hypothetical protein